MTAKVEGASAVDVGPGLAPGSTARRWLGCALVRIGDGMPAGLKRIVVSTSWLMVGHASRMLIGLAVGLYVARYLGPSDYGTLSYAISFALLFAAVAQFGLNDVVTRDLVSSPADRRETLAATLGLRLATGAAAMGLAIVAGSVGTEDLLLRLMITIIACSLFFEALDVPTAWFRAEVDARPLVVAGLMGMGLASLARVGLILLEMPVVWFAGPVLIDAVIRITFLTAFYRRRGGPAFAIRDASLDRMWQLLAHSWPLAVSAGLVMVQQRTDQVMLGMLRGPADVGWYAAAAKLSELWYFVPFAISMSVFPAVLRAREASAELYDQRLVLFFRGMVWGSLAIAGLAAALAEPLIRLLFGDAFLASAQVLQIHCWTIPLVAVNIVWDRWIVAEGRYRMAASFAVVSLAGNVAFNMVAVPVWGAPGAAWATLSALALPTLLRFLLRSTRPTALLMVNATVAPFYPSAWRRSSRSM